MKRTRTHRKGYATRPDNVSRYLGPALALAGSGTLALSFVVSGWPVLVGCIVCAAILAGVATTSDSTKA